MRAGEGGASSGEVTMGFVQWNGTAASEEICCRTVMPYALDEEHEAS